ncbi:MAG TPA: hypothetical protein VIY69_01280, partial [Candidatus Acidoferrales bacterium]
AASWVKKRTYRKGSGLYPYIEIALGLYFLAATLYAGQMQNYATMPFFLLFVWGYLYTGVMSLGQVYFERLRFGSAAQAEMAAEVRPAATGAPGF